MSEPKKDQIRLGRAQIGVAMARGASQKGNAYLDPRSTPPMGVPAVRREMSAGSVAGYQGPIGEKEKLKETIRQLFREIIRKKSGGGGYVLYSPNRGKKRPPKPVGEFPTRIAAKRAELARFPPKDTDQLKKARKRIDKLTKDPKKRADAERRDLTGQKAPKKSGAPKRSLAKAPKRETWQKKLSVLESMQLAIDRSLMESLFREEDVAGSPRDERVGSMHPDAVSSDKKLAALHRAIEQGSLAALGHGHKALARSLRGIAKVHPGDVGHDPARKKRFMPVTLEVGGEDIGPVHLYVDGGNVCVEISQEARSAIQGLDPKMAKDLRGGLMSFQEDALPRIDHARKPWADRDAYMDKIHGKLDGHLAKMSPVELHLIRQLMNTKHRGRR